MKEIEVLYHVTPSGNVCRIARGGLDPELAEGKHKRVWLCDFARLRWAIGHVAAHHQMEPAFMHVFRVEVEGIKLVPMRVGVYCTFDKIPAARLTWLPRTQRRRGPGR